MKRTIIEGGQIIQAGLIGEEVVFTMFVEDHTDYVHVEPNDRGMIRAVHLDKKRNIRYTIELNDTGKLISAYPPAFRMVLETDN